MLYIKFKDGTTRSLHVPLPNLKFAEILQVEYIQADSNELSYIFSTFKDTIPINSGNKYTNCQSYFGDIAKTILANL